MQSICQRVNKIHLILCSLLLVSLSLSAQTISERIYMKGGVDMWDNLTKEMYLYPAFQPGVVKYRNGTRFDRLMNYNSMLGTIQFIDEKKDTLAIANEKAVETITIGDDVFIFHPGCLRILNPADSVHLLKSVNMRIADIRQVGALGKTNSSTAVETPNQVYTLKQSVQLDVNEVLLLSRATVYYIGTSDGKIVTADKNSILKLFPDRNNKIREFIRAENISFKKENSLLKLAAFLSGSTR